MTIPADPYAQIENGIADRIRAALESDFFPNEWQVSNNEANRNRGAEYYVVLRPSTFPALPTSYKSGEIQDVDWSTYARLYVRFQEKGEQWARFNPFRWAVQHTVMLYRFLDACTIGNHSLAQVPAVDRIISIQAAEEAGYWNNFAKPPNSPPDFMYQPLRIVTRQRVRFE